MADAHGAAAPSRSPAPKLPAETERAFQNKVIHLAKLCHWECYHTWNSQHSEPGYPDLTLVRKGDGCASVPPQARTRIIFAELKAEKGRLSAAQRKWLGLLSANEGVEVFVWRPSDWQQIVEVLR